MPSAARDSRGMRETDMDVGKMRGVIMNSGNYSLIILVIACLGREYRWAKHKFVSPRAKPD